MEAVHRTGNPKPFGLRPGRATPTTEGTRWCAVLEAVMRKLWIIALSSLMLAGCSIKQTAVDLVGDALSGGGGVYASDEDPELVFEALPFGLKTYESMLEVSPKHQGLLLASAKGFTVYAYFIQDKADRVAAHDLKEFRRMRARARKLYLRGRDYALRGLTVAHEGFATQLYEDRSATLARTGVDDVGFLYWGGAAWAGALSATKDDLDLIAELPIAGAMVARVIELDESYERGAAHEFFISYEGNRPGGSNEQAREHYRRALAVSGGLRASTHLALAGSVSVGEQNLDEFHALIAAALEVDPDREPELRLANTIARERAHWLQGRVPELFLLAEVEEAAQ